MRNLVVGICCLILADGVIGQTPKQKAEIEQNIKSLKTSTDPKQRAAAAKALGELALVKVAFARPGEPALVDALKDNSGEVRREAVLALINIGEPFTKERIPGLLPLLKDGENRDVRIAAILMLSLTQGGAKEAVPLLEDIIKKENAKEDPQTRDGDLINRSAQALVQIREHLVGGYIKSLKEDKDAKVRAASAAELARVAQLKAESAKPAIPVLIDALRDDDAEVRKASLTALSFAKPNPQEMVPALLGLLRKSKDDRGIRLTIVTILTTYGPSAKDALPYLEFLHSRESKADEKTQDKDMLDRLTKAVAAVKGQQ